MIFYRLTNDECVIHGDFKDSSHSGVPVFYDKNGVIEAISDYFIYKSITDTDVKSSVLTYANLMQKFLRFIDRHSNDNNQLAWNNVMDRHLIEWRNIMTEEGKTSGYIRGCLETVFKFYEWAERNKHIRNHVAIYNDNNEYPISAKQGKTKTWSWPYYPRVVTEQKNTPTNDQLEKLHVETMKASDVVGLRDSLLLSIYERTARRAEALQIKVSDIPDWDELEEYVYENKIVHIQITGKKNRKRDLLFLPETMEIAREYIEGDRADAVKAAKKRDPSYREPEELFISHTSGLPLNMQYVSRRISNLMKKAGIKNASGHRVRAKALTDVVSAFDGFDEKGNPYAAEDVLIRAAEHAGHANPQSLRPYLAFSRSAGLASKLNNIELARTNEIKLNLKKKQLANLDKLVPLVEAALEGRGVEKELIKLLDGSQEWDTHDQHDA
jgi:site-specific recombinase XerD